MKRMIISFITILLFLSCQLAFAGGAAFTDPVTGIEFVFVKGGCFDMGDNFGDGYDNEKPVHQVCVNDFYMGKYDVTVGEFRQFVNDTGYRTDAEKVNGCYVYDGMWRSRSDASWKHPYYSQNDNYPVVCVSKNDAEAYANWQKNKTGKHYKLPTEAEWEYAARSGGKNEKWAGTSSESELGDYAWFDKNSGSKTTHPVGQKKPNSLGLYDMTGNVWEWVADLYGSYSSGSEKNPTGPSSGSNLVLRGGSWNFEPRIVRASFRLNYSRLSWVNGYCGFRLLLSSLQSVETSKERSVETSKERLESEWENLLNIFKSKSGTLFNGPITIAKDVTDFGCVGDICKKTVSSGWFADTSSQKKIIDLASILRPAPTIPEGAKRNFVKATTFMRAAKETSDYKSAINAYEEALLDAPWWGNAYYNLGIALAGAGWYDDAKESINLYLLTNPSEADKSQAQKKIYEIEAQQELQTKREAAIKAKYGDRRGGGFGFDALFRYGGIVQNMSFDASGNQRTISLKVVTRKENGFLHTYFQIADITSSNDTFLQKFSIDWRGTNTFYLDDRTHPNKELLTLSVTSYGDGDANIIIRPANNASASIKTSLTVLLRELASQAVYAGDKINIGGRDFYVLGQGGAKGSLLFFPPEIKDQLEHGTTNNLMPALVANVNYRGSDGQNKNWTNSDLGDVKGTHYHLEHVGDYWEAKVGRGEDH